jgi:thymidylate synthase
MVVSADRLDDLLAKVFKKILKRGRRIGATRGANRELFGVLLHLKDPRARISRTEMKGTLFSGLGELLWYLAGSDSLNFICYYARRYDENSADGVTVHGAYGPRLLRMRGCINQIENILALLREKPTSRRAVIQLFNAEDLTQNYKEIPCTCTLQFVVRDRRLHMLTHMRSNDAFVGLPHDVFAFTMLQELVARSLNVRLGSYRHAVGSMHLYDKHLEQVESYLHEGWHEKVAMPPMPKEDPWPSVRALLQAEGELREGRSVDVATLQLPAYWRDLVRLLQIYQHFDNTRRPDVDFEAEVAEIEALKKKMKSRVYDQYIDKKKTPAKPEEKPRPGQLALRWK